MNCTIASMGFELSLPTKNEHKAPYPIIKRNLLELIWRLYCRGYTTFYTNCEYGIPLWSAEIICALKMYNDIHLHLVIPYEAQCTAWCHEWRNRYLAVQEQADQITMASIPYDHDCYEHADKLMFDDSDMMLVIGTPNTNIRSITYAETHHIPAYSMHWKMFLYPF